MEMVDVLAPPDFKKSGQVKTKIQALKDGDWLGVFHLWIVQAKPEPSIIYQIRSPQSRWGPNLLDVTVGGYYQTDESIQDGLREAQEELGCDYSYSQLTYLGKKLYFGQDSHHHEMKSVVDVHMVKDNRPLSEYKQQPEEVHALVSCLLPDLIALHSKQTKSFKVTGITNQGKTLKTLVTQDRFAINWDQYHLKIALLAQRFIQGEKNLIY